jgi:hypothetical protein
MEAVAAKVRDEDEGNDIMPDTIDARSQAGETRTLGAKQRGTLVCLMLKQRVERCISDNAPQKRGHSVTCEGDCAASR